MLRTIMGKPDPGKRVAQYRSLTGASKNCCPRPGSSHTIHAATDERTCSTATT